MIKNVGQGAAEELIDARAAGGPFVSIEDFARRVAMKQANKRAVESMVKAGAFDALGGRATLLGGLDRIASLAQREQRLRETGQSTMFDMFGDQQAMPLPGLDLAVVETPRSEALAWERELLGVYVSEHPMSRAAAALAPYVTATVTELGPEMVGRDAVVAGSVKALRHLTTKQGRAFLAVEMEDLTGLAEVTVWPDIYEATPEHWTHGKILMLYVRVRERGDRVTVAVQRVAHYVPESEVAQGELFGYDPDEWAIPEGAPRAPRRAVARPPAANGGSATREPEPPRIAGGAVDAPVAVESPIAAPAPAPEPRLLIVTLQETDDEAADRERLHAVVAALQGVPGADPVRLRIVSGGEPVDLELPPVIADELMLTRLASLLGAAGDARIEEPLTAARR